MNHILIVEDEIAIVELIQAGLQRAGYAFTYVQNGREAADLLEDCRFDLVLLDIMLPEIDGYELLDYIKPLGIPVIFLTAKGSVRDRVKGLRMGAEDYLVKPFVVDELIARVETVLRRYNKAGSLLRVGDVTIDLERHTTLRGEQQVELTPKEFDLLLVLARNQNVALYRETLFERVWGEEYMGNTRTLDLHIQRLRKKLNWQDKIKTVFKIGYKLEVDV